MDAGTDNGFTFTSPNWPTVPPGVIFKITHDYPTHPAGSFHYPDLSSLPTIATFAFVKEKEYELSEEFSGKIMDRRYSYNVDEEEEEEDDDEIEPVITFVSKEDQATKVFHQQIICSYWKPYRQVFSILIG